MKRGILGTILWTMVAACIGVGLFFVKHEVKDQERRLNALNAEIARNQETIHVLRAEWSYLNDPSRLKALAEKHLGMHPVRPVEVATLDQIMRNGLPAPTMLAAATPPRPPAPPQTGVKPAEQPKPQPVKLADGATKPRPADTAKPPPGKPQPPKTGGVTVAKGGPAQPKTPALAQTTGGSR